MPSAQKHFAARPDGNGGVTLRLRGNFRDAGESFLPGSHKVRDEDEFGSYLGDDGIARRGPIGDQENGSDMVEQTVHVASPPAPGSSYKLQTLANGCVAMMLVSPPDQLVGDTINSGGVTNAKNDTSLNQGPARAQAMDRAARAISHGRGSEASKLRLTNRINRQYFRR